MAASGEPDPLFAALDPLVRSQQLSSDQANQVYRAVAGIAPAPAAASTHAPAPAPAPAPRSSARQPRAGWSRPRLGTGIGVVGAGLLAGAFLVSYGLALDGLSWKPFAAMVVPVAALAMLVAVTDVMRERADELAALAAVAGAVALVCIALTVSTAGDSGVLTYASAIALLVGGVAGYARFRRQVFVVPGVIGGLLLLGKAFAGLVDADNGFGENNVLFYGVVLLIYGVGVAALGWRLPCRHLAGVLGGTIAVGSMAFVIIANGFTGAFFLTSSGDVQTSYRSDTVMALVLGLVVCGALAAGYAAYRDAGFLVVAGGGSALLPALAVPFLTQKHPLQLAAVFIVLGTAVLGAGVALARANGAAARTEDTA